MVRPRTRDCATKGHNELYSMLQDYSSQQGSNLNAANINYDSLKAMQAMKRLKELETLVPGRN